LIFVPHGDERDLAGVGVGGKREIGIAWTRCQLSPTMRATAANGICWASIKTSASNSKVKPASLPTQSGSMSNALYGRLELRYAALISRMAGRSEVMVALALGVIAISAYGFTRVPAGFLPVEDQGYRSA
jgi:hypothetical protein